MKEKKTETIEHQNTPITHSKTKACYLCQVQYTAKEPELFIQPNIYQYTSQIQQAKGAEIYLIER